MKVIRNDSIDKEEMTREIEILKNLPKHPYIVEYVNYLNTDYYDFLITEYCKVI